MSDDDASDKNAAVGVGDEVNADASFEAHSPPQVTEAQLDADISVDASIPAELDGSGTQSGTQPTESGESGTQPTEWGGSGTRLNESRTSQIEMAGHPSTVGDFDIASPQRVRGRPKQKPKAKKAKKNLQIEMAREDSDMHDLQLSLASVLDVINGEPTYASSAAMLKHFKLFAFDKKPKAPVAHMMSKLAVSKPLTRPDELTRVFPLDLLRKCDLKVTMLQRKHSGLAERDIAIEIVGVGVFVTATLAIMKRWYRALNAVKQLDKALTWLSTIDFSLQPGPAFRVHEDPELPSKLKNLPVMSEKVRLTPIASCYAPIS